jgi:hypothetical protein
MNLVKNKLRNSMDDEILNHFLVTFIEEDVFFKIISPPLSDTYFKKSLTT